MSSRKSGFKSTLSRTQVFKQRKAFSEESIYFDNTEKVKKKAGLENRRVDIRGWPKPQKAKLTKGTEGQAEAYNNYVSGKYN